MLTRSIHLLNSSYQLFFSFHQIFVLALCDNHLLILCSFLLTQLTAHHELIALDLYLSLDLQGLDYLFSVLNLCLSFLLVIFLSRLVFWLVRLFYLIAINSLFIPYRVFQQELLYLLLLYFFLVLRSVFFLLIFQFFYFLLLYSRNFHFHHLVK